MTNFTRNFISGKMNKSLDPRLIPDGEYIDAMNIVRGSSGISETGPVSNIKGNIPLTTLTYIDKTLLSSEAKCIGAFQDNRHDSIYWLVHDPNFSVGSTGKLDMIVSFNVFLNILTYHVISIDDGSGINTTLNFNSRYLITGGNILNDLFFFTDDYNPPRVININRSYPAPIGNIDQITKESLLVIKKPPIAAPDVSLNLINGQENFLETRFICFSYRYKYTDGEYSATSQWSAPAFSPKAFGFSPDSYLNEGMINFYNSAVITYNSGSSLVTAVELLFKNADGVVIKIIEKLNKADLGLADNTEYKYTFIGSKIFTILPSSELLRLYDNVPHLAKAQTIMGNRLLYGNYVEGYDLLDKNEAPVKLEYTTSTASSLIGASQISDGVQSAIYHINGNVYISSSIVTINLSGKALIEGSSINLEVSITHSQFSGETPYPSEQTGTINLNFYFYLSKAYSSVYEMCTSSEFQDITGTLANIQTVPNACNGITFTDSFNCAIPNDLEVFTKKNSGISSIGQPINIITSPSSDEIGFQFPAMQFVNSTLTQTFYEYYSIVSAQARFQEIANPKSLHSNRGYEIGIVYMDEFNRSTTALVSQYNTEHIPCSASGYKNSIIVTIPITQLPPFWATSYKFVIKPDKQSYDTIYSSIFFQDPNTNNAFFLLEGENARKVEAGDRLIVKADSNGISSSCLYATVLEKESKASNFIEIKSKVDPETFIPIPSGVYMKINPNSFSIVQDELTIVAPGKITETGETGDSAPTLYYPMNIYNSHTGAWEDYTVPAGSRIVMSIKQWRDGVGNSCEERKNTLEKTLISSRTYDNMYEWFIGSNVERNLNDGTRYAGSGECIPDNKFLGITNVSGDILHDLCTNYYKFYRNTTTNELKLMITGTVPCSGIGYPNSRASNVEVNFTVFRTDKTLIFETLPSDALPDVFFENEKSFAIINGNHMGNIQNQNIDYSLPAIVNTNFFNCFAFGNGVESYKIRDSIVGSSFDFGNRVTTTTSQEYKEQDRFSDITYSGIYNTESNINKLNEFNLGLLNYKKLEASFKDIFIIDGSKTDVLVLQEDKISYVLEGKNLLSDSTGGGVIASIPEVLGTQIAMTEKYGISSNPESYIHWGSNIFFTDVKRGVVVRLNNSVNIISDSTAIQPRYQIELISELDMREWFRDNFKESFYTQKLGGFDPYMNEYVLSSNTTKIPSKEVCQSCGILQSFSLTTLTNEVKTTQYCVNLGQPIGLTNINFNIDSTSVGSSFEITVNYNNITTSSGWVTQGGVLSFNKDDISTDSAIITINYTGSISLGVLVECPITMSINIVQIVFTSAYESGKSIHTQYRYVHDSFTSPLQSSLVVFADGGDNPLVSKYNIIRNIIGSGSAPPQDSTVRLISNQFVSDEFIFDPAKDKFRYYVSDTLYENNSTSLNALLSLSAIATPNITGGVYNYAEFVMPNIHDYLYLIWDFRSSIPVNLCYSNVSVNDVCCNCSLT